MTDNIGIQMKRKELTKIFTMISNCQKRLSIYIIVSTDHCQVDMHHPAYLCGPAGQRT